MRDNYNKGRLCLIKHSLDGIKEYYTTDCVGMMLEVTTSVSNKSSEKLLKYRDIPKDAFYKIFRTTEYKSVR